MACGGFLLAGVLVLLRRDLAAIVRLSAVQGAALALLVAVLGGHERDVGLLGVAAGVGLLRAVVLPALMRRALTADGQARETEPLWRAGAASSPTGSNSPPTAP